MTPAQPVRRVFFRLRGQTIEVFGHSIRLPTSKPRRIALGVASVIGGVFSFLPVLGIWMLPLGIVILSVDFPSVRRARRRFSVKWGRRKHRRRVVLPVLPIRSGTETER